ncbi:DNA topoisomerase IV subunit B [Salibaculum sp.]|uniref:DNA topoisomerase IV subunit B n=1 Tax=Roseovarius halophilus (ex Wu et al. 2025) TaxID=3376060 RepID=UPI002870538D|nr:DNA topoisomerase IV subunit B [Salibaculum sp.]MDR9427040.1 DNA topoisomerase IV subunit B [Salibaculum sp.]
MADDLLNPTGHGDYDASSIEVLEGLEPVRKRPGMYIGGTDDRALHHLVAEVLDNSMDEAVAGHANRIEVDLHADNSITIRDNGRGIPIDPHPKFPEKSALEVILCTLHAGGKFGGKAYQTSGGLHGVGASVVNALSDSMVVQVARNKELHEQRFARGKPLGPVQKVGHAPNRRGTTVTFHPDAEIFGSHQFKPGRLFASIRSKAYLFSGVEIRWKSDLDDGETPTEATFHFPGGLADYLRETLGASATYSETPFSGTVDFQEKFNTPGKVEWAIHWTPSRDGFLQSYCNTVPTPEGGTHVAGFWAAILKGIKAYGELVNNRKAAQITREDLVTGGCALVSCFIREPEFVGQTKDRLATAEAQRLVENAVRDHFDNWLAADTKSAGAILDFLVLRAEERQRRRQEKETARKSATKKLRLPGKLVDCTATNRVGTELFIVEGDSAGGSAKMARDRKTQALLPLRGKILNVLGAASSKLGSNAEINDLTQALGVGLGTKFNIDDLRYDRIIIMCDADVDGAHIASLLMTFFFSQMRPMIDAGHLYLACPPLFRVTQGAKRRYCLSEAEKDAALEAGLGGKGKMEVSRFKGLGEMDAKDLKETTMDPASRKLIRVTIDEDEPGETGDLVERLMGKKPELRFQYISENARFVEELDV